MNGQATMKGLAVLASLAAFAFMFAWYGFLEPSWLSYPKGSRFEPVRPAFAPGEPIALNVFRCNSSGEQQLYLIGARLVQLDPPPGPGELPVILAGAPVLIQDGCLPEISKASIAPLDTKPGTYFIDGLSKADGRWRSSNIPWTSAPFVVRAGAAGAPAP